MDTSAAAMFRLSPRLDPKPWGGRRLGPAAPGEVPIGEAVATAGDATIVTGPLAGRSLAEVVVADPLGVIGPRGLAATGGRPLFPLLVKLIDAAQPLSIQVHPNDAAARAGGLGKTEVYHVLAAEPGATIGLGLRSDVALDAFVAACRGGTGGGGDLVRWLPAVPGESILIPAGTIHALGAGCFVYELQQPSDVTYRLDDWGRVDAAGRPRELHVDRAVVVLDADSSPAPIAPLALPSMSGRRSLLAACRLFALERIAFDPGEAVEVAASGSAQTLTCLGGTAEATAAGDATPVVIADGETVVVCAAARVARLRASASSSAVVLRAWVPALASEVVAPAMAAGHTGPEIAALAGSLPDLRPPLEAPRAVAGPAQGGS